MNCFDATRQQSGHSKIWVQIFAFAVTHQQYVIYFIIFLFIHFGCYMIHIDALLKLHWKYIVISQAIWVHFMSPGQVNAKNVLLETGG